MRWRVVVADVSWIELYFEPLTGHPKSWIAGIRPYGDAGKRVCPTCHGTGINPVWPTKICPKCNGETRVPHKIRGERG